MPKNREALIRYRVINQCLKDFEFTSKEELREACERAVDKPVSERTIDGDFFAMRYDSGLGYYAPIKYNRTRKAYYYGDRDYSIDKVPLSREEIRSLTFAATLLDQFKHVDIFKTFSGSVQKIIDTIKIKNILDAEGKADFIDFEKVPVVKGNEFLEPLIRAIQEKKVVRIVYRAFYKEKDNQHDIHPYLLKEYRHFWYLIGYNNYWKGIGTYGLDRIREISVNEDVEFHECGFSPKKHFRNSVGIFAGPAEPMEIKVKVKKNSVQYLINKPVHASQEIVKQTKDYTIFSYFVRPTVEFKQFILERAEDATVLSPPEYVKEMKKILENMLHNYER